MTDSFFRYGDRSCGSAGDERTYQSIVLTRQFRSYGEILVDKRAILSSNTEICFWRSFYRYTPIFTRGDICLLERVAIYRDIVYPDVCCRNGIDD